MIRVTRRYRFSASHRLNSPKLGLEENRALYGKCNNPFGHGHNYVVEISVRGQVDKATGLVVDPRRLDGLVKTQVIDAFDHRNLNVEIPEFHSEVPTTENLGREILRRLTENWNGAFPDGRPVLEKVRIAETERNIFEVAMGEASSRV